MDKRQQQQCMHVLDAFYRALDQGRNEEAYGMLSERDKRDWSFAEFCANAPADDFLPPKREILSARMVVRKIIKNRNEIETLELAYIRVRIYASMHDGNPYEFEQRMINEAGKWKVYHQSDIPHSVWIETSEDGSTETCHVREA